MEGDLVLQVDRCGEPVLDHVSHEAEVSEVLPQHGLDGFCVGVVEPFGHEGSDGVGVAAGDPSPS